MWYFGHGGFGPAAWESAVRSLPIDKGYLLDPRISQIVGDAKSVLSRIYGTRLKQLLLFGSWARGGATDDSDIDLMVVLADPVSPGDEVRRTADSIYDISLRHNVLISLIPCSLGRFGVAQSPLLLNVRREGVVV
jgi:predicted nucleotidyltransferase